MNRDEFTEWDAAYVLGALSTADRAGYEEHLAVCMDCAAAVRSMAVIPGLLGRVEPQDLPGDAVEPPPFDLLSRTRAAAQHEQQREQQDELRVRRHRRWRTGIAAAAASAALLTGGVVWAQRDTAPAAPAISVALQPTAAIPLTASVALYDKPWGTQVDMTCTYAGQEYSGARRAYALYVVDAAGAATSISTWAAGPGTTSQLTAATALSRDAIAQIQVRAADGTVLLRAWPN